MDFETIEPNVWKPEEKEESIEGVVLNKEVNIGVNNSNLYHLESESTIRSVWGSAVLDSRMQFIKVGDFIRITYKGLEKNKRGQETKIFQVQRRKGEENGRSE